ncbi:uncharacterized protein LOC125041729 [Penaeus chinensis]|uniref:uncharacterized protein LOC125041729 n=1 Tax=Penaeus chinensis TaxID=139456 RepID=UPI001FB78C72|nr:uncharacterized protein LOC125041729 [Penaeus chinensis]
MWRGVGVGGGGGGGGSGRATHPPPVRGRSSNRPHVASMSLPNQHTPAHSASPQAARHTHSSPDARRPNNAANCLPLSEDARLVHDRRRPWVSPSLKGTRDALVRQRHRAASRRPRHSASGSLLPRGRRQCPPLSATLPPPRHSPWTRQTTPVEARRIPSMRLEVRPGESSERRALGDPAPA